MRGQTRSMLIAYGIALLSVGAAIAVRQLLDPLLGNHLPFSFFFLAVIVTAWYGGIRPALLAVALGFLAGDYLFIAPRGTFHWVGPVQGFAATLYAIEGVIIAFICERMRNAQRRAEKCASQALDRQYEVVDAHRKLAESLALVDTLVMNAPAGMAFLNTELQYMHVNRAYAVLEGADAEHLIGRFVRELSTGLAPVVADASWQVLSTGIAVTNQKHVIDGDIGGQPRSLLASHYPVKHADGTLLGVGIIVVDMSAHERAEELLIANRRKDDFLAMLAHELRNPLGPIRVASQLLAREDTSPASLRRAREVVARQVEQIVRLVDDLLDISRIARGKILLNKQFVELHDLVERAVEMSRHHLDGRGHRLLMSLPSQPVYLEADPARLQQVLVNLLHNAAKYTEPGGKVTLIAEREADRVVITVEDTGVGISAAMLPHVFEPFAQESRSTKQSAGGMGIGLTLVKRIVEMHGGSVEGHSAGPNKGSTFRICLPTSSALPAAASRPPTNVSLSLKARRRRVLVVDDNADALDLFGELLRLHGHEVCQASDGPSALRAVEQFHPDVVILDIGLPGMDGYEVAQQIHALPGSADIILIAVTGYGTEEDRRRGMQAGFHHYLVKPLHPGVIEELLAAPDGSRPRSTPRLQSPSMS